MWNPSGLPVNHRARSAFADRPARMLCVASALSIALVGVWSGLATAAPIDDLRAKATALAAQLDENGAKVAALGEQLDAAQIKLDEAQAQIADAEARTRVAEAETARLTALVRARAVSIYQRGGSQLLAALDSSDATEANVREKYAAIATGRDRNLLDRLDAARADLVTQKVNAQRVHDEAQGERDALANAKAEADAAAAAQEQLLGQVKGQIAELVREEQARRAAAPPTARTQDAKPWSGPVPNPSGGAGAAVAFAQAQLGKPYVYAASGPDSYDCSGLTMRAWQAGGVSMPHYSGAQAALFPRVPLEQLQPGDLITTSSWSAHIGIWVGDGYIHATHTGDVIRYVAGRGSVRDAVRPG
jgi:cell wall-associated NlpC family hydrolase